MSRMDSWSRPSKHTATPPPLYLLPNSKSTPYCYRCGRVIGSRKVQTSKSTKETVKYCSERCRHRRPAETDRFIENTFVSLLDGGAPKTCSPKGTPNALSPLQKDKASPFGKKSKGEPRVTILCSRVEELVFGPRPDPQKGFGRKKNRAKRGVSEVDDWKSVDMEENTSPTYEDVPTGFLDGEKQYIGTTMRNGPECPAISSTGNARTGQNMSDSNFSMGGERGWAEMIKETEEFKQRRLEGQRKADEREAVRSAARRLCAFGIDVFAESEQRDEESCPARRKQQKTVSQKMASGDSEDSEKRKKCEAVLQEGTVVEASFAKGEWGIRWRE